MPSPPIVRLCQCPAGIIRFVFSSANEFATFPLTIKIRLILSLPLDIPLFSPVFLLLFLLAFFILFSAIKIWVPSAEGPIESSLPCDGNAKIGQDH
ncbi:hypothetical protein niasHS_012147 [Heterodera schachtii]